MKARWATGCAAAFFVLAHALPSGAAELRMTEPAVCGDESELTFRVERARGQALEPTPEPRFEVSIAPAPPGFAARLEVHDADVGEAAGRRSFSARSCDELLDTLALAIALALQSRQPPVPASVVLTEPQPSMRDAAGSPAAPAASAAPGPALVALGFLVADTGSLPAPTLGAAAGAGLAWPGFELRVIGTLLPERQEDIDRNDPESPGAKLGLVTGSALACAPLALNAPLIALRACAGWELGRLAASGTGVTTPHHTVTFWSAARLDFAARWASMTGPLGLELHLSALAPLTRNEFILEDIGSVYRPANVTGRASLGVTWSIN
jgi:hypothetical protein